jgi:DNA-binding protein H-NS
MLKNFHLDDQQENQSKISLNDDQFEEKIIQLRRSDKERRASKLAEEMIQYDLRKKMSRADMTTIRDKFSYKKIFKCLIHMIQMLVTLIVDQSNEPQILRDAMQRSD